MIIFFGFMVGYLIGFIFSMERKNKNQKVLIKEYFNFYPIYLDEDKDIDEEFLEIYHEDYKHIINN